MLKVENCEACRIMKNIIKKTLQNPLLNDWHFREFTINEIPSTITDQVSIEDFPTTCFIIDGKVVKAVKGATPQYKILSLVKFLNEQS